ncbi:MAG: polysaccharide biosynthesis protein [Bacteroidales bacterium]|nr:polysaccharide biosynthesis protein [Bacteroidales bacterium]
MATVSQQGKTLAKNTVFMYIRMALLTVVYFYTSRVLLKELGVDDFGIYSLVGSVVAMFESIKVLFTASTQRFLNYEMGRNNKDKLISVFNTSIYINIFIALLFIAAVEIVGLWFLDFKANIPVGRTFAAQFVFQTSLFATIAGIVTTPYEACVIAHEKMDFYALISVIDGILKLVAVLLLPFIPFDKLIFYGSAVILITVIMRLCVILYCNKHFRECKLKRIYDKALIRQMISFAGWRFVGNASFTVTQNGLNMLLNIFGGTVVNAARGISYQVKGAVSMFLNNITIVVNPYITRSFASGEKNKMFAMLFFASKAIFILDAIIVIPLLFLTDEVLAVWLGSVPLYSVVFVRILLLNTLVSALHQQIDVVFMASGKMKTYQICEGILLLLPVLLSYIGLRLNMPFEWVFVLVMAIEILDVAVIVCIAKKVVQLNIADYLKKVILPCLMITAIILITWQIGIRFLNNNIITKVLWALLADSISALLMLRAGLTKEERNNLRNLLSNGRFSFLKKII